MIKQLIEKYRFDIDADRLGPDCPFTHWNLYFKKRMLKLCINKFAEFYDNSEFRSGAYAVTCSKIHIGKRVIIRPSTMLFAFPDNNSSKGSIFLEDNVMLGSGVHIYTSNHRFDLVNIDLIDQGHSEPRSVTLKKGCWIGANVIILPGVTIGENSVVGAGSVVTKSVPGSVVVAGNPSVIIRSLV